MKRHAVGLALTLLLAALSLGTAHADPINSPHAQHIGPLVCNNGMSLEFVSPSGPTPVAHVIGSNGVLIVAQVSDVGTAADGTIIYNDGLTLASGHGKASGVENLLTCVNTYTYIDTQYGPIDGVFTVTGFLTPRS